MQNFAASLYTKGEVAMREGAWINAKTGDYCWIDDHARWLRRNPKQAAQLGLPDDVIAELGEIGWDITPLAERIIVLHKAMNAGFIRARGHGSYVTFEFTILWEAAIRGARRFMAENFGASMTCRFNSLDTNKTIEFLYGHYSDRLGDADLSFLLPPWKRPRVPSPVRRPFLVAEVPGEGWVCWPLPDDHGPKVLVDLIRGHVPEAGGWLALADGRCWKVSPSTPPLSRVDDDEALRRFEICPDCGWPRIGTVAPCQCFSRSRCATCDMPTFWPVPTHEHVHLDGRVLHVPHFAAYAHKCVPWAQVKVHDLPDPLGRS